MVFIDDKRQFVVFNLVGQRRQFFSKALVSVVFAGNRTVKGVSSGSGLKKLSKVAILCLPSMHQNRSSRYHTCQIDLRYIDVLDD